METVQVSAPAPWWNTYRLNPVQQGRLLAWLTLACCAVETAGGLATGILSRSGSLLGFGVDSLIEISSATAIMWLLQGPRDRSHRRERVALRVAATCFFLLACFVTVESAASLLCRESAPFSPGGVSLAIFSLLTMPALARMKRRVGIKLNSGAIQADSRQSALCGYLALIVLTGLIVNRLFGFWWADPVTSLAMVPVIVAEGVRAFGGQKCAHCS